MKENFNLLIGDQDHLLFLFPFPVCLLLVILSFLLIFACSNQRNAARIHQRAQFMMGTLVEIKVVSPDPNKAEKAMEKAFLRMRQIEDMMSAKKPGNWVDRIGKEAVRKPLKIPDELFRVIERCQLYAQLTDGAFDISIGSITRLWRFDKPMQRIPADEDVQAALQLVGFSKIHLDPVEGTIELEQEGMGLDLGGAAKGYAVDEAVRTLRDSGIDAGIVNAGGDLKTFGTKPDGEPWHIGIQDPQDSERIIGSILLEGLALVTSGDYERYMEYEGKRYHHIVDPKTGWPARGSKSVSVSYMTAFDADILSTAIFVLGPEEGLNLLDAIPGAEGMIMDTEGTIRLSRGWKDNLKLHRNTTP